MNQQSRRKNLQPLVTASSLLALIFSSNADLLINEIRIDNGASDLEYVELHNNGETPVDLTGYTYLVIGDGAGGSGVIEAAVTLSGSVPAGGYFVLAESNASELITGVDSDGDATVDITVTPNLTGSLNFENGENTTHLLVLDFSGANGDDLDTDDNGTLDSTPWTGVVDAVSPILSPEVPPVGTEHAYAVSLGFSNVGPDGTFSPGHVYRSGDGPTWTIGAFGTNAGSGVLAASGTNLSDSPGVANPVAATGTVTLDIVASSVAESAGGSATTATVTRTGSTAGDLTVFLSSSDASEIGVPASVIIFDGQSASDPFDIAAIDDLWPDGDQSVTVEATATNYGSANDTITVTDDPGDIYSLVVNEVYYGVDASLLDANGDGTADTSRPSADEFVEIVNTTGTAINLTGYTVKENFTGSLHEFPEGTVIPAGAALVIFGGGEFLPGSTASFGTAEIQKASVPGLFLDDTGDFVQILDSLGQEVHRVELPDQTASPAAGSYTLATDGTPASGYVYHTALPGAAPFSPGVKNDTTPFNTLTAPLGVVVNVASAVENVGVVVNGVTVSIPVALAEDLVIRLYSSDTGELTVPDSVILTAGQTSVSSDIFPQDDAEVDGTVSVAVTATASGFLNDSDTLDVEDDGSDVPVFTDLVINEIDADQTGSDTGEFVELYNKTGTEQSLTGLVLVFFNGSNDLSYSAVDLAGFTIPANGYFVVGNTTVSNVDLTIPDGSIQNGQDAVALYAGSAASFPNNTSLAAAAIAGTLVDAVVYDNGQGDDTALLDALTPGKPQVNESGGGSGTTEAIARVPDGGAAFETALFVAQAPTPGATNVIAGDFDTWVASFEPPLTEGPAGDDDGDGKDNTFEYAFGLDPQSGGSVDPFAALLDKATATFTYTRRTQSLTGLTYKVFTSTTLAEESWVEDTGATVDVSGPVDDVETVEVTLSAAAPLTAPKLFVRVVAE